MSYRAGQNRPFKFGANDRREFIVTDGEVALRAVNNAAGDPVYLGRAKCGTTEAQDRWQIQYLQYDANAGVVSVTWPENDLSNASTEYEFVWNDATASNITGITQANPGVVTSAGHPFTDGQKVIIESVAGMTEVNFDNTTDKIYIVANAAANTFELTDISGANVDTSGYTAYSSGGTIKAADWANYTYS